MNWKDEDGSDCGLIKSTLHSLPWKDWGKPLKALVRIPTFWSKIWNWDLPIQSRRTTAPTYNFWKVQIPASKELHMVYQNESAILWENIPWLNYGRRGVLKPWVPNIHLQKQLKAQVTNKFQSIAFQVTMVTTFCTVVPNFLSPC